MPPSGDGGAPDAPAPMDGGTPGVMLPNPCAQDTTFCEQATGLGIDPRLAYGRGVAVVDVDGDGWLDVWRSDSGSPVDGHELRSGLYRNQGDGTFEPWDVGIAEEDLVMNWGGIFGDIDEDGDPDLFLANGGYEGARSAALYRNDLDESGRFVEITEQAGIDVSPRAWWGGSFADYDLDGDLDLLATARGGNPDTAYDNVHLYENDGTGTFTEVSNVVGLPDPQGDMKNPTWIDYDRDGDPDLVLPRIVLGMSVDQKTGLFENRGPEGFVRVDPALFPGEPVASAEVFVFAVAAADFDQDGWQDLYLGRWDEQDYIAVNQGDGSFELVGQGAGLVAPEGINTMGLGVGDFTGDGFPDVLIGPGNPTTSMPPLAFCSTGRPLELVRCEEDFQAAIGESRWHGPALGDIDRDFDQDVVWNLGGFADHDRREGTDTRDVLAVFVNHGDPSQEMARVRLEGTESPTTPIGAKLRAVGEHERFRVLHGAQGFQAQNARSLLLPLGDSDTGTVDVTWPSGQRERFGLRANDTHPLVEGTGTALVAP